jgi:transposase InsO family protein
MCPLMCPRRRYPSGCRPFRIASTISGASSVSRSRVPRYAWRQACLNEALFTSMAQARAVLAAWRQDYNTIRPHSKLGRLTPAEIAGQRGWGHAPIPVAITSTISHQSRGLSV